MTEVCGACESKLSDRVSDCCGKDVWTYYSSDDATSYCSSCGQECKPVPLEDYLSSLEDEIEKLRELKRRILTLEAFKDIKKELIADLI